MQWFYADQGKSAGPVSEDEFQNLVASGKITPNTLVWHEGMAEWVKHETLRGPRTDVVTARVTENAAPPSDGLGNTPNKDLMAQARESLKGNWGMAIAASVLSQLIVSAFCIPYLNFVTTLLLSGPMTVGLSILFITLCRRQEAQFSMMFNGFQQFGTSLLAFILLILLYFFWIIVFSLLAGIIMGIMAFVFKSVAVTALVSLLITIPVIRIIMSYLMTFFVIADNNEIGAWEAIKASKRIMDGMRWKCFCLYLRFIPWMLLIMAPFFLMIPLLVKLAITTAMNSPSDILSNIGGAIIYLIAAFLWVFIGSLWLTPYIWASLTCFYNDIKDRISA